MSAKQKQGQYEAAVADCNEAIRLKPDDAGAYLNRGIAKHELGRHADAIADYDEAIRLKTRLGHSLPQPGCRENRSKGSTKPPPPTVTRRSA